MVKLTFIVAVLSAWTVANGDLRAQPIKEKTDLQVELDDEALRSAYQEHLEKDFHEHMSDEELQDMFGEADVNKDGYVDMAEYIEVQRDMEEPEEDENNNRNLGQVDAHHNQEVEFKKIDKNGNGYVTFPEFKSYMSRLIDMHRKQFHEDVHNAHAHDEL